MKKRICHITTVHASNDTRIYIKECQSLSEAGCEVFLVAPDDSLNFINSPIRLEFIPREPNRFFRLIRGQWHAFIKAFKTKAEIYHFHDPELILLGIVLKIIGKKVIYDVHEDLPRQILTKRWLPKWSRKFIAFLAVFFEWLGSKCFDGIVTATPLIQRRFPSAKTVLVQNFPILGELQQNTNMKNRCNNSFDFVYVGNITRDRGIKEMVKAMEIVSKKSNALLHIGGKFANLSLEQETIGLKGWHKVKFYGWLNRFEIATLFEQAYCGLVLLHPIPNYVEAYPVKLFEYMSAKLPVIASDFTLWRNIVTEADCGLLANPLDPHSIAEAMQWIINHPKEAQKMGENGFKAIKTKYNWTQEKDNLIALYEKL